jgi:hypothetical protein
MDIPTFMPDDSTFSTRTHLPEISVWIPTHMPILPFYLKGGVMFFEEFRTFANYMHVTNRDNSVRLENLASRNHAHRELDLHCSVLRVNPAPISPETRFRTTDENEQKAHS